MLSLFITIFARKLMVEITIGSEATLEISSNIVVFQKTVFDNGISGFSLFVGFKNGDTDGTDNRLPKILGLLNLTNVAPL